MNINYQKTLNKNNLILSDFKSENYKDLYHYKMVLNNNISGLLKMESIIINNSPSFFYDITRKHSLSSYLSGNKISYDFLKTLLFGIYKLNEILNSYLIEWEYLLLIPELIYINPETKEPEFCYCPFNETYSSDSGSTFVYNFRELMHFLLSKIDYKDNSCVVLSYSAQKLSMEDFFSFDLLFELINKEIHFEPPKKEEDIILPIETTKPATKKISLPHDKFSSLLLPSYIAFCIVLASTLLYFFLIKKAFSINTFFVIISILGIILSTPLPYFIKNFKLKELEDPIPAQSLAPQKIIGDTVLIRSSLTPSSPTLKYTGNEAFSDILIDSFPFTIGKLSDSSTFLIDNPLISRIHARFYYRDGLYFIEDMNSSNGTYLNKDLISPHSLCEVNDGDFITLSHLTYIFKL